VRRLRLPPHQTLRPVQKHLLLLPLLPKTSLEEAQEDVQGPNHPSRHLFLPPNPPQGHGPPEYVHTEKWGWRWANECGGGVSVASSRVLIHNVPDFEFDSLDFWDFLLKMVYFIHSNVIASTITLGGLPPSPSCFTTFPMTEASISPHSESVAK